MYAVMSDLKLKCVERELSKDFVNSVKGCWMVQSIAEYAFDAKN